LPFFFDFYLFLNCPRVLWLPDWQTYWIPKEVYLAEDPHPFPKMIICHARAIRRLDSGPKAHSVGPDRSDRK
jgi:hypothetical protein